MSERYDAIVIGGGQAGLVAGYFLKRAGMAFVILEGAEHIGDVWRKRWDSLRLFTPAAYSSLPGLRFPGRPDHLPGKDEVADYLEAYAAAFELPVQVGTTVRALEQTDNGYMAHGNAVDCEAPNVVVATGPFQVPAIPSFASKLDSKVVQIHSGRYRNPAQLPAGPALVVGGQASGLQIAEELAASRPVYLSVGKKPSPYLPRPLLRRDPFWWFDKTGFVRVPIHTRFGRFLSQRQEPLVGTSARRIRRKLGVQFFGRTVDAGPEAIVFSDGRSVSVRSVVWATGYRSDYSWIRVPVLDEHGYPIHDRGVTSAPGLFFLGLSWQHTRGSALIGWVGEDAKYIVGRMRRQMTV